MKYKFAFSLIALVFHAESQAVELVCKGRGQQNSGQRVIEVNCSNRKEVIDMLGAAWQTLRKEGIGGAMEDMCWKPFNKAKEIHPSIDMEGIAPTFFMQCNIALQYVK